MRLTSLKSTWS